MGIETGTAILISSLISAASAGASIQQQRQAGKRAESRSKKQRAMKQRETEKLEAEQAEVEAKERSQEYLKKQKEKKGMQGGQRGRAGTIRTGNVASPQGQGTTTGSSVAAGATAGAQKNLLGL